MHLVCLGVVRTLVSAWALGPGGQLVSQYEHCYVLPADTSKFPLLRNIREYLPSVLGEQLNQQFPRQISGVAQGKQMPVGSG